MTRRKRSKACNALHEALNNNDYDEVAGILLKALQSGGVYAAASQLAISIPTWYKYANHPEVAPKLRICRAGDAHDEDLRAAHYAPIALAQFVLEYSEAVKNWDDDAALAVLQLYQIPMTTLRHLAKRGRKLAGSDELWHGDVQAKSEPRWAPPVKPPECHSDPAMVHDETRQSSASKSCP